MARSKVGEAIRNQMQEQGLTQGQVAKRLKRSQTWVSQSLLDDTEKTLRRMWVDAPEMFEALLKVLNWEPEQFVRQTGIRLDVPFPTPNLFSDEASLENPDLRLGTRNIPVYDLLAAGPGSEGGEIVEYLDIPDSWQGPHAAYIVEGDSMSPRIPHRSRVIIRCQDYASPDNIIVCYLPDEGMLVKYLKEIKADGAYLLVSFNPNYDPIWAQEINIKGIVREIRTPVQMINGQHG